MIGVLVQMLASVRQSGTEHVVMVLIVTAFVLGVLVLAGWLVLFDRRRDDGVDPVDSDTEENREEAA
jgi:hypothetical protein